MIFQVLLPISEISKERLMMEGWWRRFLLPMDTQKREMCFSTIVRKTIGHAAVFMTAQIFTFLALYMFLYEKKWWLYSIVSLGEGLFICVLSELIQHFVPTRDGTVKDVFIDFAGVVVGFALAFLTLLLIKKIIKKKKEPQNK